MAVGDNDVNVPVVVDVRAVNRFDGAPGVHVQIAAAVQVAESVTHGSGLVHVADTALTGDRQVGATRVVRSVAGQPHIPGEIKGARKSRGVVDRQQQREFEALRSQGIDRQFKRVADVVSESATGSQVRERRRPVGHRHPRVGDYRQRTGHRNGALHRAHVLEFEADRRGLSDVDDLVSTTIRQQFGDDHIRQQGNRYGLDDRVGVDAARTEIVVLARNAQVQGVQLHQ